jgi:hypothetical protein
MGEIDKVRKGREGQGMDDAACGTKHGCMKHEAQGRMIRYGMVWESLMGKYLRGT